MLRTPNVSGMAEAAGPDWSRGVPPTRLLHPCRVQIVESIRRAGRPLSAAELVDYLGGTPVVRTGCHLRRLRRLGVILPSDSEKPGRHALTQRYRLKEEPET